MINLWITTFIWAFSFPVIGYFISGKMDSYFAIFARTFIAFLVFLPLMNYKIQNTLKLKLMLIGSLQIGIMYIFYYNSFLYLKVSEVAVFTIFTPFYITLFYDILSKKFRVFNLFCISLSVIGAYVIKAGKIDSDFLTGFLLIQGANIVFALAQCLYKRLDLGELKHKEVFGYFFAGASFISLLGFLTLGDFSKIPSDNISYFALIYLGLIASSIGYFLWNKGTKQVSSGTLALMNNAIIPVAILVNILLFGVDVDLARLSIGTIIMAIAMIIHHKFSDGK